MIFIKIDINKIDKTKFFIGKTGAKYLDIVLIETPGNQYGDDYMAVQGLPKEDRDAGQKGAILGNAKIHGQKPVQQQAPRPAPRPTPAQHENLDEDVPF